LNLDLFCATAEKHPEEGGRFRVVHPYRLFLNMEKAWWAQAFDIPV
jgi:hypothetical protein